MEINREKFLQDIDKFIGETKQYTRRIYFDKGEFKILDDLFLLYFDFLKSIHNGISLEESKKSGLHYKVSLSLKSIRILLPYFYLSIKGFYDEANIFTRNFVELSLILVDIGYNPNSLIFWKNNKPGEFTDINKVIKRIDKNKNNIPEIDLRVVEYFKSKYYQVSQDFSHELRLQNIEKILKADGSVKFSDRANEEFLLKRIESLQAQILNAISLLVGVTHYDDTVRSDLAKYPEAISLRERYQKLSKKFEKI